MIRLQPPRLIRGVVFSENGEPAKGVIVSMTSAPVAMPDIAGITGESGDFILTAPAAGRYVVTVSYPSGNQESRTVDVGEGSGDVTLEVRPRDP